MIDRLWAYVFARGGKTAFACAIMLGGLLGFVFPQLFVLFFGWADGPTLPILSLVGLGIYCGGYVLYEYLVGRSKHVFVLNVLVRAGLGTVAVFVKNFSMGYPVGMTLLIIFAGIVAIYGFTALRRPSEPSVE